MSKELSLDELGVIFMALNLLLASVEEADNAPPQLIEIVKKALSSIEPLVEKKCNEYNAFAYIAEQLDELSDITKFIVKNPNALVPDCYYS